MQVKENTLINQKYDDEHNNINVRLADVLKTMNIRLDTFATILNKVITSKAFAKMATKDQKEKLADNEQSAYPEAYQQILINFIMNSEIPSVVYESIVEQFLSQFNDNAIVDTPMIEC